MPTLCAPIVFVLSLSLVYRCVHKCTKFINSCARSRRTGWRLFETRDSGVVTLRLHMAAGTYSLEDLADSLCATARWCYTRGWAPATSGNFSVRAGSRVFITPSGLDKGTVAPENLLEVSP